MTNPFESQFGYYSFAFRFFNDLGSILKGPKTWKNKQGIMDDAKKLRIDV